MTHRPVHLLTGKFVGFLTRIKRLAMIAFTRLQGDNVFLNGRDLAQLDQPATEIVVPGFFLGLRPVEVVRERTLGDLPSAGAGSSLKKKRRKNIPAAGTGTGRAAIPPYPRKQQAALGGGYSRVTSRVVIEERHVVRRCVSLGGGLVFVFVFVFVW